MATAMNRAQAASDQGEAAIKENPSGFKAWALGDDGRFFGYGPGMDSWNPVTKTMDYAGNAAQAAGGAIFDPLVDWLGKAFTSDFFKRLAAAIAGMVLIFIVIARFAGEQAGVV